MLLLLTSSGLFGQNLKLRRNTLFFTIFFSFIAFDGFSQNNCPLRISTNGDGNRIFSHYDPAPSTCRTSTEAIADLTTVTVNGVPYALQDQASADRLRNNPAAPDGTFTGINSGTITITFDTGESCTYVDGVLDLPPPDAGFDGFLCEDNIAGTTPTDAELFAALGGTPQPGGVWTNVGDTYTYTVTAVSYFPCLIDEVAEAVVIFTCEQCICTDFIYLNEPNEDRILKFKVESDGSLSGGGTWYSGIVRPHGIGMDNNGFVYVAEQFTGAGSANNNLHKLACDGTLIETGILQGTIGTVHNVVIDGRDLYTNVFSGGGVQLFDVCTEQFIGQVDYLGPTANSDRVWGLSLGEDGCLYSGGYYTGGVEVFKTPLDATLFTNPATTTISPTTPLVAPFPNVLGVDTDANGCTYVIGAQTFGTGAVIYKLDPMGNVIATATDSNIGDGVGFNSAVGLVYSPSSGFIYVSTQVEDCIAVFDTNLNYQGNLSAPNNGAVGKAIGLVTECCPTFTNFEQTLQVCASSGETFSLSDLLPCEGLCASGTDSWVRTSGTGGTLDDCDFSFEIDATTTSPSCFEFSGGSTTGTGCSPYTVNVCVEIVELTPPVISGGSTGGCASPLSVSVLSSGADNISYQWQQTSEMCTNFEDIIGATETTFTPPAATSTISYRVVATDALGVNCEEVSNCITVAPNTGELPNCRIFPANPAAGQ